MNVDFRLRAFWTNLSLWHKTKQKVWADLIKVISQTDTGPGGKAAKKFIDLN